MHFSGRIASLALLEQPDGRWTVRVERDDGEVALTVHEHELDARMAALDVLLRVPVS